MTNKKAKNYYKINEENLQKKVARVFIIKIFLKKRKYKKTCAHSRNRNMSNEDRERKKLLYMRNYYCKKNFVK